MTTANGFATTTAISTCPACGRRGRLNRRLEICYRCFSERGAYEPTPEEIRAACAKFQATWSRAERRKRSGGLDCAGGVATPVVSQFPAGRVVRGTVEK